MTENRSNGVRRGRCRVCGRQFRLRKDGTVWSHGSSTERLMNCSGGGRLPVAADLMAALRASVDAAKARRSAGVGGC